jgi:hypothetical protein
MNALRTHGALTLPFALAMILPFLQAGCGDDSKTSGTQLQMSPEAKAQIKDMRDMYKENKGMKKQERKDEKQQK